MSVFDLLFIGLFFATVIYGGWIVSLAVRRRWGAVRRHALRLSGALGAYMIVVITVGLLSPRRVFGPNEMLRYDDWELGVETAAFADAIGPVVPSRSDQRFLVVTLRVRSTAGRVRQAAPAGALVYVSDQQEVRSDVAAAGQAALEKQRGVQPELTLQLEPGGSFRTTRVFEVSRHAGELFLGHRHGSGVRFPGPFIITEGFHPAPVIRLTPLVVSR